MFVQRLRQGFVHAQQVFCPLSYILRPLLLALENTWFNSLCNPDLPECLCCVVLRLYVTVIYTDFFVKRASVICSSGSPQQCFLVGHSHSSLAYALIRWVRPWVLGFGSLCSLLLGNGFKGFLRPSIELYRSPFATALSRIMIEGLRSSCAFSCPKNSLSFEGFSG